jgi:hypothetical protein
MFNRAKELLTPRKPFGQPAVRIGTISPLLPRGEQRILRMMIRSPETGNFQIPEMLDWLAPAIGMSNEVQEANGIRSPYVYVTVRHGAAQTNEFRDDVFHVDGFSMRKAHVPEQNYIWSNRIGTEILEQEINLPEDFDPFKHNIHQYFQDVADTKNAKNLYPGTMYAIDPYVVHRRPVVTAGMQRTFFRISYIPIEIEDDTCMINPLIPRPKPYNREDIRHQLSRYPV